MHRIRFIHPPPDNPAVRRRAIIASLAFHGVALAILLVVAIYYAAQIRPRIGSTGGAPTMTLEPMVVTSTPSEPPPPSADAPTVPMPPLPTEAVPNPLTPAKVPDMGTPVLPPLPMRMPMVKTKPSHEKSHGTSTASAKPSAPRTAPLAASAAPGANVLPHPPYPDEARNRGETGTVVVLVEFNARGDVAHAEIAKSSGVPLLDSWTRSFCLENWHDPELAGQSFNAPVVYHLDNH